MSKKFLWVFGNAVQDITVEVDIERLSHELGSNKDNMISLSDQGPEINPNLWLKTQIGIQHFEIQLQLDESPDEKIQRNSAGWYVLEGGKKYTLKNGIVDSSKNSNHPTFNGDLGDSLHELFLPCENLSWGGGGTNVVTFLRALAPDNNSVPIKYTDIAMSRSLPKLGRKVADIFKKIGGSIDEIYKSDPVKAEKSAFELATIAANYSPERSLEVYLASLPVECVLYRPENPKPRMNWVFSHFRSAYREVNNKIILRGSSSNLQPEEQENITSLLEAHVSEVGAILLNSLKDEPLFKAAYSIYKSAYDNDENVVAILAMTDSMQRFTKWMLEKANNNSDGKLPPFILVFNETEAYNFAKQLGGSHLKPFMVGDGLPDIKKFAELVIFLHTKFNPKNPPRIYVTLGPRGSLGVDGCGHVIYVSGFSKSGATVYDTNACGDAYCSAIALLEWAKRHGGPSDHPPLNIANVKFHDHNHPNPFAEEMQYFMSVATATAYCKATNRRGRVYAADIKDLLEYSHRAGVILPTITDLANLNREIVPECVDENFRLREPSQANFPGVTKHLSDLIG